MVFTLELHIYSLRSLASILLMCAFTLCALIGAVCQYGGDRVQRMRVESVWSVSAYVCKYVRV